MKFISWNVNGLRACLKKGFLDFYQGEKPDFCCLQETKMEQGQADVDLGEGILEFWNSAEKKGYSGTAVFTPHKPLAAACGMDKDQHDHEGRLITLEYEKFYLVCCYTPNSQDGLKRLPYRMEWEDDLREYLVSLDKRKPVIYCGDLNVAHRDFRFLYPDVTGVYSWWSYRFNARKNNAGWRIDYFIVSDRLQNKIKRAEILTDIEGSDHCPVLLELDL